MKNLKIKKLLKEIWWVFGDLVIFAVAWCVLITPVSVDLLISIINPFSHEWANYLTAHENILCRWVCIVGMYLGFVLWTASLEWRKVCIAELRQGKTVDAAVDIACTQVKFRLPRWWLTAWARGAGKKLIDNSETE